MNADLAPIAVCSECAANVILATWPDGKPAMLDPAPRVATVNVRSREHVEIWPTKEAMVEHSAVCTATIMRRTMAERLRAGEALREVAEAVESLALSSPLERLKVLHAVNEERIKQDRQWGEPIHHPATWHLILCKQVGQAAEALLDANYTNPDDPGVERFRHELTQVAAVAIAALENLDDSIAALKRKLAAPAEVPE